jgi:hypothetical protein
MKGQWGRDLVRWDKFPKLAAQLIGWVVPPPGSTRLTLEAQPSGDQLILSASAYDDDGRPADGLHIVGELLDGARGRPRQIRPDRRRRRRWDIPAADDGISQ